MEQNWRAGLAQDSRNKIVDRIMDTFQRRAPDLGQDGMTKLWKSANRFEEHIFNVASDQNDYLQKISMKMLNLELRTQNAPSGALPTSLNGTNSVRAFDSGLQLQSRQQVVQTAQGGLLANGVQGSAGGGPASSFYSIHNVPQPTPVMNALGQVPGTLPALNGGSLVTSGDSLQQVGQPGGTDQADIVWSKMQTLKDKYLQDMKDLYNRLTNRSQQHMPEEQLQKLTHYKNVLQRMLPYLIASKGSLPKEFKQDKVEVFEKQIVSIMETFKRRKQVALQPQQPGNLSQGQAVQQPQPASHILQPESKLVQQQASQMNPSLTAASELQSNNVSSSSFPLFQSNVSWLQQTMGGAIQPTPHNSLANGVQQGNITAFGQNNINTLQINVQGLQQPQQQQQQDQQFHQNRLPKEQEQSKQLQVWQLQLQQQQHLQKQQLLHAQQAQLQSMPTETSGDSRMAKHAALKQIMVHQSQKPLSSGNILHHPQQQKAPPLQAASSPQMSPASQLSPQSEVQNLVNFSFAVPKVETPLQASTPPFMMPSPSTMLEDSESKPVTPAVPTVAPPGGGQVSQSAVATPSEPSAAIGTPGLFVSPLLGDYTPSPQVANLQDRTHTYLPGTAEERQIIIEPIRAINNMSAAVSDMSTFNNLSDKPGGSAPGARSKAAVGEDLAQVTKCRTQARVLSLPDGSTITKKGKRRAESMALSLILSDGSVVNSMQRLGAADLETESTSTSRMKRSKIEVNLQEEIKGINFPLIETRAEIDHQQGEEVAAEGREGVGV